MVGRGNNWSKNADGLSAGDRIFIWRGGRENGFIAEIRALAGAEFVGPLTHVPWPDPGSFGAVFAMELVHELDRPLPDNFPDRNRRNGLRYGFNNTVLQHVFEEIDDDVASAIAADFSRP